MTRAQALRRAQTQANRSGWYRYVIWEDGEYFVTTDHGLENEHAGARVISVVEPN